MIDLSGGRNNQVHGNHLGIDNGNGAGQYDYNNAAAFCQPGTNDSWAGNFINSGVTNKNPKSGS